MKLLDKRIEVKRLRAVADSIGRRRAGVGHRAWPDRPTERLIAELERLSRDEVLALPPRVRVGGEGGGLSNAE